MIKHVGFFCWSIISVVLSSGLIVKFIEDYTKQRELYAVMVALENEYKYNTKERAHEKCSFQNQWLGKALSLLNFHEQCPDLMQKNLEIYELMKDANEGNLEKRKKNPQEPMSYEHLFNLISSATQEIDAVLPILKKRATFKGYTSWLFSSHSPQL